MIDLDNLDTATPAIILVVLVASIAFVITLGDAGPDYEGQSAVVDANATWDCTDGWLVGIENRTADAGENVTLSGEFVGHDACEMSPVTVELWDPRNEIITDMDQVPVVPNGTRVLVRLRVPDEPGEYHILQGNGHSNRVATLTVNGTHD